MVARLPWLVNLAALLCDIDKCLSGRVSDLHSVVACSISSRADHGIHCRWYLIRSKQLSSGSVCHTQCLPDFQVMVIQFIIYIISSSLYIFIYIYIYIYIVIHRQTVSFNQNSSVWLDTQDARSVCNRNSTKSAHEREVFIRAISLKCAERIKEFQFVAWRKFCGVYVRTERRKYKSSIWWREYELEFFTPF